MAKWRAEYEITRGDAVFKHNFLYFRAADARLTILAAVANADRGAEERVRKHIEKKLGQPAEFRIVRVSCVG